MQTVKCMHHYDLLLSCHWNTIRFYTLRFLILVNRRLNSVINCKNILMHSACDVVNDIGDSQTQILVIIVQCSCLCLWYSWKFSDAFLPSFVRSQLKRSKLLVQLLICSFMHIIKAITYYYEQIDNVLYIHAVVHPLPP